MTQALSLSIASEVWLNSKRMRMSHEKLNRGWYLKITIQYLQSSLHPKRSTKSLFESITKLKESCKMLCEPECKYSKKECCIHPYTPIRTLLEFKRKLVFKSNKFLVAFESKSNPKSLNRSRITTQVWKFRVGFRSS